VALGGVYAVSGSDDEGFAVNPAAAAFLAHPRLSGGYTNSDNELRRGFGIIAYPTGWGTFGLEAAYNNYSWYSTVPADGGYFEDGIDPANDYTFGVGYSRVLFAGLSAGVTGHIVRNAIDGKKERGFAVDFGALWRTPLKDFEVGFAGRNFGPELSGDPIGFINLPYTGSVGASYRGWSGFAIGLLDVVINRYGNIDGHLGIEINPHRFISARIGFGESSYENDDYSPTAGIGLHLGAFDFDFAFRAHDRDGYVYSVGGAFNPGKSGSR